MSLSQPQRVTMEHRDLEENEIDQVEDSNEETDSVEKPIFVGISWYNFMICI